MATHSNPNAEKLQHLPLYLLIQGDDWTRTFELNRNDERVVAVGSASSADIQLERPGVSPIHFYFERMDDDIWIVPAYCVSELRVNTAKVTSPSQLGPRSIVEFGNSRIVVAISPLEHTRFGISSTSRSGDKERSQLSYLAQLPDEDEPTRQPCISHNEDEPTRQISAPVAAQWDQVASEEVSSALAMTLIAQPQSSNTSNAPKLSAIAGQLCIELPTRPPAFCEIVNVAPLSRTLLGIAPAAPVAKEPAHHSGSHRGQKTNNAKPLASPSQLATLLDVPAMTNVEVRRKGWLARLGLLTKRYPARVCVAAISVALAGSGTVVLTTKMIILKPQGSAPRATAQTPPVPLDVAKPPAPPAEQMLPPSIVVVSPGPTGIGVADFSTKGNRSSNTAEFKSAALSLVQGQYIDAQVAYASLAARSPADPTYAAISQLLARRIGPLCANSALSGRQVSCPEIKP